jgi:hypothetical protein
MPGHGNSPEQQSLRNYWFDPAASHQHRRKRVTTNSLPGFTPDTLSLWETELLQPASTISEPAAAETPLLVSPATLTSTLLERTPLPVDPEIGEIPDDLQGFVTYVPLHLLSEEERKRGIMPYVTTTFFVYSSDRFGYMPGIMLTNEETQERKPMNYGMTNNPNDINAAYEKIRHAMKTQRLVTASEVSQKTEEVTNPLLTVLSEDEIYIDPFELLADEAQEQGYPLLRRDVKSFRWWLEFGYDVRDDPPLYAALKENKWKWGGYRQQWFNPNPYAKVPEGLYYGNAGPCFYSEERAERLEARQQRASAQATEHHERSDKMASIIPFGQPMMPDHYSYKSDLSYRKKIWRQMDKFVEYYKKAEWLGERAESSRRHQAWKDSVFAMKNRLDRLEADVRSMRRRYQDDVEQGESRDLDHWRRCMTILATEIVPLRQAIDAAGGLPIEQMEQSLKPGDYIKIAGRPQYVVRVNKTTITCAHPTLTLYSGKPWETKYKKSDFQELLATAEQVAEARKKAEAKE